MPNTKTRSEAAVLVIVVFFLGALLGVVGNHLWGESVWGKQISAAHPTRDRRLWRLCHLSHRPVSGPMRHPRRGPAVRPGRVTPRGLCHTRGPNG